MGSDQILETAHRNPLYDENLDGLIDAGSLEESFNDSDAQDAVGSILQDPLVYNSGVPEIVASLGGGIALDGNGALVADLGNGLGVDGSGRVYIPASAVSQSMLGFDTATQSELNSHADATNNPHNVTDAQTGAASALSSHSADSDAHHSRPASTSGESVTAPDYGISITGNSGDVKTVTAGGFFEGIDSPPFDAEWQTIELPDGTTLSPGNSSTSWSPQAGRFTIDVKFNGDYSVIRTLYGATFGSHSHSI